MGRFFNNINVLKNIKGTIASALSYALSSYPPFQQIKSIKKGKYSRCLEREKREGRFFFNRPLSSGTVRPQLASLFLASVDLPGLIGIDNEGGL